MTSSVNGNGNGPVGGSAGTPLAPAGGTPQSGVSAPASSQTAAGQNVPGLGNASTAMSSGVGGSQPNLNPLQQPPAMKTLVYSPDIRVVIAHNGTQYDVSTDIVHFQLHRAEGQAASFSMTVSNKGLRYTPANGKALFSRMDRIVVYLKRTQFVQVFSGYLDNVPYKQLYPGTVDFRATCTIKRLMYTWWNPALPSSSPLIASTFSTNAQGDGAASSDADMGSMLRRILNLVGGWQIPNIHIQNFPTAFFKLLQSQITTLQSDNDKAVAAFKGSILGSDISAGPGAAAGYSSTAGAPGPFSPPGIGSVAGIDPSATVGGTTFYLQQIIAACDRRGLGPSIKDNNLSAGLAQAGLTGQNGMSPTQQKAWQQVQQTNLDAQNANRSSDAAIIAAAVAAVETGGGISIHNWSNPSVPGSNQWGEGPPPYPTNLDSCGTFQQRNSAEWGDVSQRMNPLQAAGMFLDHLTSMVPNWRNTDPGAAAQTVQRSSGSQGAYSAAIKWATPLVQAIRTASTGAASSTAGSAVGVPGTSVAGPINAASGAGAPPSSNPSLIPAAASITPAAAGIGAAVGGKPVPDSEGAVQFALSKVGRFPYVWGGKGPANYDCSGLVSAAFASINVKVPSQTGNIRGAITQIPKSAAGRGDIYEPESGHVTILLGPPGTTLVQASTDSVPLPQQINVHAWYPGDGEWYGRACANGGADLSSPYSSGATADGGVAPSAIDQQSGALGMGTAGSAEPIARNLFSYMFLPGTYASDVATMWPGEKAFVDGEPLIQVVKALCGASLRQFMSAPNGDFMAYYPDWWGLDGKPAVYRLEDIELKDVRIDFSDDALTTHVYVEGDFTMIGQTDQTLGWMDTAGVATVEDSWLYQRLIAVAPGDPDSSLSGQDLMRRYGIRPLKQTYSMAGTHELELTLACQVFMEKWAQQYQTTISTTFMPELYPGMRIELASHNLSVYVTEVTHNGDFTNGFSTTASIMAPANPNARMAIKAVKTADGSPIDDLNGQQSDATKGFTDPTSGIAVQQGGTTSP